MKDYCLNNVVNWVFLLVIFGMSLFALGGFASYRETELFPIYFSGYIFLLLCSIGVAIRAMIKNNVRLFWIALGMVLGSPFLIELLMVMANTIYPY